MAISYVAAGAVTAAAGSATAPAPAYPAGMTVGDVMVLVVGTKPYSATITTPAGWVPRGTVTNGTTAAAADVGSTKIAMFTKVVDGSESGSLTLGVTSGDSSWAQILAFTKGAATEWEFTTATGTDTTSNTSFSVLFGSDPGIAAGDYLVLGAAGSTDAAQTWSAGAVTVAGATVTAPTLVGQPLITTGFDSGGRTGYAPCTAGASSAAPTWTATLSSGTNALFSAALVRLREIAARPVTATLFDDFTTQDAVKWYGWATNVVLVAGTVQIDAIPSVYPSLLSNASYDLTGSYVTAEVVQTPTVGAGTTEGWLYVTENVMNSDNALAFIWNNNNIRLVNILGSVYTETSVAYDATSHRWWRLREAAGTVYWETSPDGRGWTTQRSLAVSTVAFQLTSLRVFMMGNDFGSQASPGVIAFDNFNLPPPIPLIVRSCAIHRASCW